MNYIISFCLLMGLASIYGLIRSAWVYHRRIEWNDRVYAYRIALIQNGSDILDRISYENMFNSITSYSCMMLSFSWALESFVVDWDIFNMVRHNQSLNLTDAR